MDSGRVLIETLGEHEEWTVLAVQGRPSGWRSMARVLSPEAQGIAARAHRDGERVEAEVLRRTRGAPMPAIVCATPVFGPGGDRVHAVQVHSHPVGSSAPAAYRVAAFDYSSQTRSIHLVDNPFGWELPGDRANWTVPEAFRYVERCDGSMELILQTLDPAEQTRWAGDISARVGALARRYRLALRNGAGAARTRWHGLLHDVTESLAPEPASLDTVTLAALGRQRPGDSHIVLADVEKVRLIRWVTEPVPGIQWKGMVDDRDTPHPDDVARIFAEMSRVLAERSPRGTLGRIRLRRIGGGWTVVEGASTMVPAPGTPKLMLIQLTVTGYSDDPDPTEQ